MRALLTVAWLAAAAFLTWHAVAYKAPAIEQDILARSKAAVKAQNARADAIAYGRFIVVKGQAPDEATKTKTLAAANEVWGALGPYDEIAVSTYGTAALVLADKAPDGSLRLSGTVPSDAVQASIESAAKAAFPGSIDNRLTVADTETMDTQNVEVAFKTLVSLDAGTLVMDAKRTIISGSAADLATVVVARETAAANPETWQLFVNAPTPPRFGAVKLPDGTILASGDVASEDVRAAFLETFQDDDPGRRIVDRLAIRADGVSEAWTRKAMKGANALAELDWGSVSLDGAKSYLAGMAGPSEIGRISDSLGSDFTAELTPRPSDRTTGRISAMERELRAAKSRILDLSAAAAKHLADLNAAEAQVDELRRANTGDKSSDAATRRIAALETAAARSKDELDSANARIAGLTEMLSLQPVDMPPPADALPAPSPSSLRNPTNEPASAAPQPLTTGATPPAETENPETSESPAQDLPPPAASASPPEASIETAALSPPQDMESVAAACNAAIGSVLSGASISFESKSAQITREGNDVLDRLIAETAPCIGNPALKVTVGGHTDSRGQDRDNLRLSKERADSVKESLIVRSIPPEAITAIGYGETLPVADNESEEGRAANRRITIDWSLR